MTMIALLPRTVTHAPNLVVDKNRAALLDTQRSRVPHTLPQQMRALIAIHTRLDPAPRPIDPGHSGAIRRSLVGPNPIPALIVETIEERPPHAALPRVLGRAQLVHVARALFGSMQARDAVRRFRLIQTAQGGEIIYRAC